MSTLDEFAAQNLSPKIRLFNAKFSPNLGDGLLSECLEAALIEMGADQETWSIDLAGRREYGDEMMGRAAIMSVLDKMPPPMRKNLIRVPLAIKAARNWRPHYAALLHGANATVIGGGNLLSDMDLNFPTKLTLAVEEAEKARLPVFVYAAGVARDWSKRGEAMLKTAFGKSIVKGIFVRDAESKQQWDTRFGQATGHIATVVRDPGLLAQEVYAISSRYSSKQAVNSRPVFGIGLMSHLAIRYHSAVAPSRDFLDQWYVDLAKEAINQGYQVCAFTNGSPEDRSYAADLYGRLRELGDDSILSFPTSATPRELCEIIAHLDVLVAYRMHAIIAAYSLGVPAIALTWDRKLTSFMKSVDREHWLGDVNKLPAVDCVKLATETREEGILDEKRLKVLNEARDGVRQLYAVLRSSLR